MSKLGCTLFCGKVVWFCSREGESHFLKRSLTFAHEASVALHVMHAC